MNKLYEMNYAGCHMVVDSLEVIGDLSGKGMKQIKKSVNELQAQTRAFEMEQTDYWSALASDGIITVFEKKTLYKEFKEIQQTYATLRDEAITQGLEGTSYFQDYESAYDDLHDYLYTTIGLFNDMNSETAITDRTTFDSQFATYYKSEKFTTLCLATGIMGNLGFKVLTSLSDPGTEGEIGLYRGTIYQYTSGEWLPVGLEGYMGVKSELPNASLNQYFMAGETFLVLQLLLVNDTDLLINGDDLYINQEFQEGFIYFWNGETWEKVKNTSDYRYVVAMVDLVSITGQLPGVFQEAIDKATEGLISHLPEYLGPLQSFPSSAVEGDWFVYAGSTVGSHINSDIYEWDGSAWQHVDPTDASNSNRYMEALDDILALDNVGSAHFSYIFANSFWSHSLTTERLSTRTLYLRQNGYIQSDGTAWVSQTSGLRIDYNGNIDANGNTHIGGNCVIDGEGTIGKNMKILGDVDISGSIDTEKDVTIKGKCTISGGDITVGSSEKPANGCFSGNLSAAGGTFSGSISTAGDLSVSGKSNLNGDVTIGTSEKPANIIASGTFKGDGNFTGDISGASGTFKGNVLTSGDITSNGNMYVNGNCLVEGLLELKKEGVENLYGIQAITGQSLTIGRDTGLETVVHYYSDITKVLSLISGHATRLNEVSRIKQYISVSSVYEILKGICNVKWGSSSSVSGEIMLMQYEWENGKLLTDEGYIFIRSGNDVYKLYISDTPVIYKVTPSTEGSYVINASLAVVGNINAVQVVLG